MIDLPVYVYRSKEDGPVLLLTAGLHGDEINGIETIRRITVDKSVIPAKGTVIAIPVVNIYGFIHMSRKFMDGKDPNRSFPGSKSGSLASLLAHILIKEIIPLVDVGVDFHTGGASKINYPHIRCNFDFPEAYRYAGMFKPPFLVHSKAPDNSFRKAAALLDKPVLTFEGGESLRLHELSIKEAIKGIHNLMHALGMTAKSKQISDTQILKGSRWYRAGMSGIFRSDVEIGKKIKRGETLGYITDPFGESEYIVKALNNGFIIGINNLCVVTKGEALVHIGLEQ
jgi:predicted deacylase